MMKNKKFFEEPTLEMLKFDETDIITTSNSSTESYPTEPKNTPETEEFDAFS